MDKVYPNAWFCVFQKFGQMTKSVHDYACYNFIYVSSFLLRHCYASVYARSDCKCFLLEIASKLQTCHLQCN